MSTIVPDELIWVVGNAITGKRITQLNISEGSSIQVSAAGDDKLSCSVMIKAPENRRTDWKNVVLGGSRYLAAITDDNRVIAAGILNTDFDYEPGKGRLELSASSVKEIFEKRFVHPVGVNVATAPKSYVHIEKKSPRAVVASVLNIVAQRYPNRTPILTIDDSYVNEGGDNVRTYVADEFVTVSSVLRDAEEQGWETVFQPLLNAQGSLYWKVVIGSPARVSGFNYALQFEHLDGNSVNIDLSEMTNQVYGIRKDEQYDDAFITVINDGGGASEWLLQENTMTANESDSGAAMALRLGAQFNAHRLPEQTFEMSAWDHDGSMLRDAIGANITFHIQDDPIYGTVSQVARVLAISATGKSSRVKVLMSSAQTVSKWTATAGDPFRRYIEKNKINSANIKLLRNSNVS